MIKVTGMTVAALAIMAVAGGCRATDDSANGSVATQTETIAQDINVLDSPTELVQAPAGTAPAGETATAEAADEAEEAMEIALDRDADEAPEMTQVTGQLLQSSGAPVSGGVVYFVFQNRLNEIPHTNPLDKIKAMTEIAATVDSQGTFTLKMKPGNFAMVYDPSGTDAPSEPGPESMASLQRLTPEQVQARIAAIKENAAKGLPIENGKIGDAFVIENRFVRPPVTDFGELPLQNSASVTVKALDGNGELINFPATLRLRGKNGDIMEPHTPSISKRALYEFHDLMPQSYEVFALGTRPRPGAGDEITTPTINNSQLIFAGDAMEHEVVVELPSE